MGKLMEKQISARQRGWVVDTDTGRHFVPGEVLGVPHILRHDGLELVRASDPDLFELLAARLRPYVEGEGILGIRVALGFFGRFSAPGYLDCTPWVFGETKREVNERLRDLEA